MTLHPISVVDHVLDEYRSYLRTEFQARDPKLRKALEDALDRPLFLAQEPLFRAHRLLKRGWAWQVISLESRPIWAAYLPVTAYISKQENAGCL